MSRLWYRAAALIAVGVPLAVVAAWWCGAFAPNGAPRPGGSGDGAPGLVLRPDPPDADPRDVSPTPFRNVKADVAYVGDAACAACHREIAQKYHAHPMGRSAEWTARADPVERYDAAANNPFSAAGFQFRVDNDGKRAMHWVSAENAGDVPLPKYAAAADVALGSGTRGRTYLTIQDGAVWQSPVSWFAPRGGRWDLSPQHELEHGGRRLVGAGCLFCHTHRVEPIPGSENRYREPLFRGQVSIGCERCHGPGQLHVAARQARLEPEEPDHSIVNPGHLPDSLKADVCRQCHLQGVERVVRRGRSPFEYRPGLPWDQFVSTFVLRPDLADYRKSVGQFEQMEVSRCFTGSGGKLGCVSCHDPHAKPAATDTARFYRARCLTCHDSRPCTAPAAEREAKADSCVACHMPRAESSTIVHASVTDHRMARRPSAAARPGAAPGRLPQIIPYEPGPDAASAQARARDWGIAAGRVGSSVPEARALRAFAADKLGGALKLWPGDAESWVTLAGVRGAAGDRRGAVQAAQNAVALAPTSETALARLALEAMLAEDHQTALEAANKLVALSPTAVQHWVTRAEAHILRSDWAKAEADARRALDIQPLYWKPRLFLAVCRYHQGDEIAAHKEAHIAARLIPSESLRTAYLAWFREKTR